jgi:hypothetical protein
VLIFKKYLGLPAQDKSTISQLAAHFCETSSVAKNWKLFTINKKNLKMIISIYCSRSKNQCAEHNHKVVHLIQAQKVKPKSLMYSCNATT